MSQKNSKVDLFIRNAGMWQDEFKKLRQIALDCGLTEEIRWSKPCYTYETGNVVILQGFKAYCALLFFKGFLLKDPKHILIKTGENTRVGRQIRFTNVAQITKLEPALKAYIKQAIKIEKSGLKVNLAPISQPVPKELKD